MFSSPAYAQAAGAAPGGAGGFLIQIVPLILLFVIFWFLIIRPQQQKMKACNADAAKQSLKGDERKKFMSECLKK